MLECGCEAVDVTRERGTRARNSLMMWRKKGIWGRSLSGTDVSALSQMS